MCVCVCVCVCVCRMGREGEGEEKQIREGGEKDARIIMRRTRSIGGLSMHGCFVYVWAIQI